MSVCHRWFRRHMGALVATLSVASATHHATAVDIIPFASSWNYLNPTTTAQNPGTVDPNFDANWFKPNFSLTGPNAWSGPSAEPFVRGTASNIAIDAFTPSHADFQRSVGTFITLPDTPNRLTSYFRHTFTTTKPLAGLALDFLADDGVRFYLDGQEILSHNCCLTAATNGQSVPPGTPTKFTDVSLAAGNERGYTLKSILSGQTLAPGTHVLAAAVHQQNTSSNDMGFSVRMIDGYAFEQPVIDSDNYKYFTTDTEPSNTPLDWTKPTFNDNNWKGGQEPFGYEVSVDAPNNIARIKTDTGEMYFSTPSIYLRKSFSVSDPTKFTEMQLTADYDDGFVAYVNGTEVARRSVPGTVGQPVAFDTTANDHESTNGSAPPELISIDLSKFPNLLKSGANNVLAIQGINTDIDSSDFYLGNISLSLMGVMAPPSKPGDFNGDGQLAANDIDTLTSAIRSSSTDLKYDLNADRSVNAADRLEWVNKLKNTYIGDANLDGQFNTADFVSVFQAGQFEDATAGNSTWATGDWNGDGDFGSGDFVLAFQSGGFEAGTRPGGVNALAAVPEPSSLAMLSLLALGLVRWRRGGEALGFRL